MFLIVFLALLMTKYASGGGTQFGEVESCDGSQLDECRRLIPRTPVGLPRNKDELDAHCLAYHTGMSCMDAWIKRCLPGDGQKFVQQQIGGARVLMHFLCTNETALRKEFLKEPQCWSRVSPGWSQCVNELTEAVREIVDRTQQLVYFNRNTELCCARDAYLMCVADVGRVCSSSASTLLKKMAFVLAQDVAACPQQACSTFDNKVSVEGATLWPKVEHACTGMDLAIKRGSRKVKVYCAAPPPPVTAPLLTALYGILFYPPRF